MRCVPGSCGGKLCHAQQGKGVSFRVTSGHRGDAYLCIACGRGGGRGTGEGSRRFLYIPLPVLPVPDLSRSICGTGRDGEGGPKGRKQICSPCTVYHLREVRNHPSTIMHHGNLGTLAIGHIHVHQTSVAGPPVGRGRTDGRTGSPILRSFVLCDNYVCTM